MVRELRLQLHEQLILLALETEIPVGSQRAGLRSTWLDMGVAGAAVPAP